jgi:hypothetical protein
MHFSEDDLKDALRRKDPGPGFTQRVMARISQKQEAEAGGRKEQKQEPVRRWRWRLSPALASALAAMLLIASGVGYRQYERVQAQKRIDQQNAEMAKQKVMLALRITNAKLNHVFQRVNQSSEGIPKIRRQSL